MTITSSCGLARPKMKSTSCCFHTLRPPETASPGVASASADSSPPAASCAEFIARQQRLRSSTVALRK